MRPEKEIKVVEGEEGLNEKGLQTLYNQCFPSVQHMVITNNGDGDDARDVFQEAFIIFYEKQKEPGFILTCSASTFIYSIGRRLWLKKLGERNRFSGLVDENHEFVSVEEQFPEMMKKEKRIDLMHAGLQELGEPCATLLKDFYVSKMSMEDLTEKFGYTNADNAKNQKYKCLQRLKKYFFANYKNEL
jgi:RNA polymerase sigma factor (sigma-70 family)